MESSSNFLSVQSIKAFFTFIIIASIVGGFFTGLISPDVFVGIASSIITYFYKQGEVENLTKQVENKDSEIQSLKTSVVVLSNK